MMFKGAYTSEFYRALRDALHAEVESWNERRTWAYSVRDRSRPYADDASACVPALWRTVEQLEMTCRNHDATQLPVLVCSAAD